MADKIADKLERIYTVPLQKAYDTVRSKRAKRAVQLVRWFMVRHMKSPLVAISNKLNGFIWQYSREKAPRRVKVRAVRQEGKVNVYLHDEKIETPIKKEEKKAEAKEKTAPAPKETPAPEKPVATEKKQASAEPAEKTKTTPHAAEKK